MRVSIQLLKELEGLQKALSMRKIFTFYPDDGSLRRELYVPHMKFFEAGEVLRETAVSWLEWHWKD